MRLTVRTLRARPGAGYSMCLQEVELLGKGDKVG
jgi:hypothetical protein